MSQIGSFLLEDIIVYVYKHNFKNVFSFSVFQGDLEFPKKMKTLETSGHFDDQTECFAAAEAALYFHAEDQKWVVRGHIDGLETHLLVFYDKEIKLHLKDEALQQILFSNQIDPCNLRESAIAYVKRKDTLTQLEASLYDMTEMHLSKIDPSVRFWFKDNHYIKINDYLVLEDSHEGICKIQCFYTDEISFVGIKGQPITKGTHLIRAFDVLNEKDKMMIGDCKVLVVQEDAIASFISQ